MTDRTVCVTDGGDTLKFVDIFARCCCGGPGVTTCDHSSRAFVINTWTLRMTDMTWVMDAIVAATELWSLNTYVGLPHKKPTYPVVSIDDSHIICFLVWIDDESYCPDLFWKIMLDTRSKSLLSVIRYEHSRQQRRPCWMPFPGNTYLPSKIFDHLISDVTCSNDSTKPQVIANILASTSSRSSSHELSAKRQASPDEILAALEEIPDLASDELLKAYSILVNDNGRRFRSLLMLPMSLRKKWLLIEIKNSEACSICSACTDKIHVNMDASFVAASCCGSSGMVIRDHDVSVLAGTARIHDPRWLLLEPEVLRKYEKGSEWRFSKFCPSTAGADPNTEATCLNSAGHVIRVFLCRESPPASSRLCYTSTPNHDESGGGPRVTIVAVHAHSVLIQMSYKKYAHGNEHGLDHFVYSSGGAAAAPSLSLLPIHGKQKEKRLDDANTGLLCRGERDLVVAELTDLDVEEDEDEAELLVFRSGEWRNKCAVIIHDEGKEDELYGWRTDMVVPVGDRLLCWVDLYRGVILCDMFDNDDDDEALQLRYVSLPVDVPVGQFDFDQEYDGYEDFECKPKNPRFCRMTDRTVCVTDGGNTLKFVNIFPRCCCGCPGVTTCSHSSTAFIINTWTLRMDDLTWVMDAIVDATELWSLNAYAGLPHKKPRYPVMSIVDSHIICLLVCIDELSSRPDIFWKIMLDTRSKRLLSVICYEQSWQQRRRPCWLPYPGNTYFPSKIFDYLISDVTCSNDSRKSEVIADTPATTVIANISSRSSSHELSEKRLKVTEIASPEEILAALEEIPDLASDDLLKAYSILINDNGRRFRSLLVLPKRLRKKWLLIEIKNSEACSNCFACTNKIHVPEH
uniref:DUF1618 domain-containing protein n=1 Tax=Leersia perrieri TaxID=77586 RepID=A0A0D9XPN1_9ORYZ